MLKAFFLLRVYNDLEFSTILNRSLTFVFQFILKFISFFSLISDRYVVKSKLDEIMVCK